MVIKKHVKAALLIYFTGFIVTFLSKILPLIILLISGIAVFILIVVWNYWPRRAPTIEALVNFMGEESWWISKKAPLLTIWDSDKDNIALLTKMIDSKSKFWRIRNRPVIWMNLRLKPYLFWIDAILFEFLICAYRLGFDIAIFVNDIQTDLKERGINRDRFKTIIKKYLINQEVKLRIYYCSEIFRKKRSSALLLNYLYGTILPEDNLKPRQNNKIDLEMINFVLSVLAILSTKVNKDLSIIAIARDETLSKFQLKPIYDLIKSNPLVLFLCSRKIGDTTHSRDPGGLRLDISIEELEARLIKAKEDELFYFYKLFVARSITLDSCTVLFENKTRNEIISDIIGKLKDSPRLIGFLK